MTAVDAIEPWVSIGTPLGTVRASTKGRPKGLHPYRPQARTELTVRRILALFEQMAEADALPLGPRTCGYRLKEMYVGEYTKQNFEQIGDIIKRLQQSGRLPWSWVADASAVTYEDYGYEDPASFCEQIGDTYRRDRREGQATVVEIYTEARETLGLIRRLAAQRGVTVYSGGGSCGPNLAHKPAARAMERAARRGQSTLILGICDFDQAGIRNVMRPHLEHVAAFLYGTDNNELVVAVDGLTMMETDARVTFRHLALTPEMALDLVETEFDRQRVANYVTSGHDIWTRDLQHLERVQKVETEALDPTDMRDLVVAELDAALDQPALEQSRSVEEVEREDLVSRLAVTASELDQERGR